MSKAGSWGRGPWQPLQRSVTGAPPCGRVTPCAGTTPASGPPLSCSAHGSPCAPACPGRFEEGHSRSTQRSCFPGHFFLRPPDAASVLDLSAHRPPRWGPPPEPATKESSEFTSTCSRPHLDVSKSDNILNLPCDICLVVIGFLKKKSKTKAACNLPSQALEKSSLH